MKTLTEKYNAVLEGKFSKSQFVKDAKRELPKLISPYNGYQDTIQILKSKGMIFEAVKDTYVSSAELEYSKIKGIDKFPIYDVERGIDYELEAAGFDSVSLDGVTLEEKEKACKKVVKNLEKDPLHYINLISGESSKVDKHDKMVPVKKGNEVDVHNGMKKATLKENKIDEVELPSAVLSKANVAVKDAKSMAGLLLQFIDQVDDKENPNIFKNAKLKRAVEFLKDLSDDEASAPAATNEKAFVRIAKGPNDVIDPADYIDIAHGYLKGFNKPYNIGDDDLKNVGRKIVNSLYNGDIDKAKKELVKEQMTDAEMAAIKDYGKEEKPVKPYVLGDKFSTNFDYEGMLKAGLKVRLNTSLADLEKLYDSFEDVNYHSENRLLADVIDKIEKKDKPGALDAIKNYKKALNKTLDSINEGTSPIREVMNIDRLGRKKSDKESNYTGGASKKLKEYRGSADDIDRIVKDKAMDSGFEEREEAAEVIEYLANKYNLNLKMIQSYMDSPDEPVNPFAEDDVEETKGAPKGHYFTKSGNLVKGRLTKDARERGARLSDPKDKQRSKVPPVTQYKNEGEGDDRHYIKVSRKHFKRAEAIIGANLSDERRPVYGIDDPVKMDYVDNDGAGNVIFYFMFKDEDIASGAAESFMYDTVMDLGSNFGIPVIDHSPEIDHRYTYIGERNNEITESTQEESVAKQIQDYYRNPNTGVSMISDGIVSEYFRTHKDWDQDGKWDGTKEGNERGMNDFNEFFDANYGYMFPSAGDLDEKKGKDHDGDGDIDSDDYMAAKDKAIKKAMGKGELAKESIKAIITKVLEEGVINEAATQELAKMADSYAGFDGMKGVVMTLQDIVTDIERYYENTRSKIQKAFDAMGNVKNEEGLKVGGFLAPAVETAFNRDLKPVTKQGFTRGIEQPKVKVLTQADIDAAKMGGAIAEEEPKQTVFTPVNETKIKIKKK